VGPLGKERAVEALQPGVLPRARVAPRSSGWASAAPGRLWSPIAERTWSSPIAPRALGPGTRPSAIGDPPEPLDVEVNQLGRPRALIAVAGHRPAAQRLAGERIEVAQRRHPVAGRHPADRRGRDPRRRADPAGAAAPAAAHRQDPGLQPGRIDEAAVALEAIAPQPPVGGGA